MVIGANSPDLYHGDFGVKFLKFSVTISVAIKTILTPLEVEARCGATCFFAFAG